MPIRMFEQLLWIRRLPEVREVESRVRCRSTGSVCSVYKETGAERRVGIFLELQRLRAVPEADVLGTRTRLIEAIAKQADRN